MNQESPDLEKASVSKTFRVVGSVNLRPIAKQSHVASSILKTIVSL
jgi:hypothetical protein